MNGTLGREVRRVGHFLEEVARKCPEDEAHNKPVGKILHPALRKRE